MTSLKHKQPSLFISHGTNYEAFKSDKLKNDFKKIRETHILTLPDTIVIFSGHWQTQIMSVTASKVMKEMEEGIPSESKSKNNVRGNPELANKIVELLNAKAIQAIADSNRGLDHGALIPLYLLFSNEEIPVIQISQQYDLDPLYHKKVAEALIPLRGENILFIGSGGLVHNIKKIQPFGGHDIVPDSWASDFDSYITAQLNDEFNIDYTDKTIGAYNHERFQISHPTTEHYLPLVFTSALGGKPTKIYEAFQWKNLSMAAFKFE
jgi:4,5-DOPA dioxygenase extradiol